MIDDLKNLLKSPIEDGVEEIRNRFEELFGELPREERTAIMLLLSVTYVLNENAGKQIEAAAKLGKKPGPNAMDKLVLATLLDFTAAVRATVEGGLQAAQDQLTKKGK